MDFFFQNKYLFSVFHTDKNESVTYLAKKVMESHLNHFRKKGNGSKMNCQNIHPVKKSHSL